MMPLMAELPGGPVTVPVTWVGTEEVPVVFVNQMLGQVDDRGDVILSFGQVTPPALIGTPQEQAAQAQRIAYVPVKPVARFTMSRPRVAELIGVLTQVLQIQNQMRDHMRKTNQGENL
jgi:hypothetical protein